MLHTANHNTERTIIVTGHPGSGSADVYAHLTSSGMDVPTAGRQHGMTAVEISSCLVRKGGARLDFSEPITQVRVTPLWMSLGLDLLLANSDKSFWGWHDPHAAHMLEFWLQADPAFCFVFVYDSPENSLCRSFAGEALDDSKILEFKNSWINCYAELLRFYSRHSERCLLVNASEIFKQPTVFLQEFNLRMKVELAQGSSPSYGQEEDAQLLQVAELLLQDEQLQKIYESLQSLADLPLVKELPKVSAESWNKCISLRIALNEALSDVDAAKLSLAERDANIEAQSLLKNQCLRELGRQKEEVRLLKAELNELQESFLEKVRLEQEIKAELEVAVCDAEAVKNILALRDAQIEIQNSYLKQGEQRAEEINMLQVQLHEVQEKLLGKIGLEQELKNECTRLSDELKIAHFNVNAVKNILAQRDKDVEAQQFLKTKLLEEVEQRKAEVNILQAQLDGFYGGLIEKISIDMKVKDLQEFLESQCIEFKKKCSEDNNFLLQYAKKIDFLASGAPIVGVSNDVREENKLLLSQLHEVQEELLNSYLKSPGASQREKSIFIKSEYTPPSVDVFENAHYGAADRVKRQLAYRIGRVIVENSRSFTGAVRLPWALMSEIRLFKEDRKATVGVKNIPIERYADAHEAEKVKMHLSYRLGKTVLDNYRSPIGWVKMPFFANKEIKEFRKLRAK